MPKSQAPTGPLYDDLDPAMQKTVDALVDHAQGALWPERRTAVTSLWRGIAKSAPGDQEAALQALGIPAPEGENAGAVVFRILLTAYLERLNGGAVTNPDQAFLYGLSLRAEHGRQAEDWLADHPEHVGAVS